MGLDGSGRRRGFVLCKRDQIRRGRVEEGAKGTERERKRKRESERESEDGWLAVGGSKSTE
jgi:hypothetical protein